MASLVDIPGNPVPQGAICDTVTADDGVPLRYARWAPNRSPVRGSVLLVHGRTEFIEKYFETVEDLRRRGFAVAAFDARGQGGSGRVLNNPRKGHIRDFADHVNDLEVVIHQVVLPDCPPPYYVLAHSTGAMVALLAATRLRTRIERMVLSSPLVALAGRNPSFVAGLTGFLMYFGLGETYAPGGGNTLAQTEPFDGNLMTSDRRRYARALAVVNAEPSLGIGGATIGWVNAAMRASLRITEAEFVEAYPVPTLMLLAGAEKIVSNQAAENLSRRLKTAAHLRIPGSRHEILMERDEIRDQFWIAFDAFIQGRD